MISSRTSLTVGIIGGTIWGNRGAEAMLATCIGRTREIAHKHDSSVGFHVFSYLPDRDQALLEADDVTIHSAKPQSLVLSHLPFALLAKLLPETSWPQAIKALKSCDVLLDIPGISFADNREKFLPFNVLTIYPAMLLGVPVIKMPQALGPFEGTINRSLARYFLPRCEQIFARGPKTADALQQLGLAAHTWEQTTDLAFLYDEDYTLSSENTASLQADLVQAQQWQAEALPLVGIIPSALVYESMQENGKDYVILLADVIRKMDGKTRFIVLPNATREGLDAYRNNDIPVISELRRVLGDPQNVIFVDYDINTAGTRQLLKCCDMAVSSRFHGMISTLSLGLPVIVIGWGHKYAEIAELFQLKHSTLDYKTVEASQVLQLLQDTLEELPYLQTQIKEKLLDVRSLANRPFAHLEAYLFQGR